jgi:hypothetical protein
LTPLGWQRAGALVAFFSEPSRHAIATPHTIYACAADTNSVTEDGKSLRPQQTVTPLARRLNITIDATYALGEEDALVKQIATQPGVVLVAWEHKHIPIIAAALHADAPAQWPGDRFDVVWVLTPHARGYHYKLVDQSLLHGDA